MHYSLEVMRVVFGDEQLKPGLLSKFNVGSLKSEVGATYLTFEDGIVRALKEEEYKLIYERVEQMKRLSAKSNSDKLILSINDGKRKQKNRELVYGSAYGGFTPRVLLGKNNSLLWATDQLAGKEGAYVLTYKILNLDKKNDLDKYIVFLKNNVFSIPLPDAGEGRVRGKIASLACQTCLQSHIIFENQYNKIDFKKKFKYLKFESIKHFGFSVKGPFGTSPL